MNSNEKILLKESDNWTLIACPKMSGWEKQGCKTKKDENTGLCYVDKTTCKKKPTPPKPKEDPKPKPEK